MIYFLFSFLNKLSFEEANKKYNIINNSAINIVPLDDIVVKGFKKKFLILKKIIKTIKEQVYKCDFLIARMPSVTLEGNIAIYYAKKYKKPYVIEVVSCVKDSLWNHSFIGKLLAYPSYFIARYSIKSAPNTIYVTKEYLEKCYPCTGKNFTLSDVQIELVDEKRVKEKYFGKFSNKKLIIGSAGAVNVKYKGHDRVIKALSILKDKFNIEYQIIGNGSQERLRKIAKQYGVDDKVLFLGNLPHNKINNWLDTIDIYIQPSKNEGLPRALIEAMSRGLFCLGSKVGGIPELLKEEYMFKNSKYAEKEIAKLLLNLDEEKVIIGGIKNLRKAREFSEKRLKEARDNIYKEILKKD